MKKLLYIFICAALLAGCAAPGADTAAAEMIPEETLMDTIPETTIETVPETAAPPDPVRMFLDHMSLEERVGQLFLARHPQTGAREDLQKYQLGGFILFAADFEGKTPEEVREMLRSYQDASKIPLLIAVDEEGGTVSRVSRYPAFRGSSFRSPRAYFNEGGMEAVLGAEEEKALLLTGLGINVNMGPVADMAADPGTFMYSRSLGQDGLTTGQFIAGTVEVYSRHGLGSVLKHFPGYGGNADTHTGAALDQRDLSALESTDLVPFRAGIDAGCGAIMVSHNTVTAFDPELPASLSQSVHRYLRQELGFGGVIITDDLVMGAIQAHFTPGEAAVRAVLAGNDLLCCTDYGAQYEAVLAAVLDGQIPIDRLNEAVTRVLLWKQALGLIDIEQEVSSCP